MADLTIADIDNYLKGMNGVTKIALNDTCGCPTGTETGCRTNGAGNKYSVTDADSFLLNQILTKTNYYKSKTTKDNFLELYNDQYTRNVEVFVGILIVSGILAKMIFYPSKV